MRTVNIANDLIMLNMTKKKKQHTRIVQKRIKSKEGQLAATLNAGQGSWC